MLETSLTDKGRVIIYDRHVFIVWATGGQRSNLYLNVDHFSTSVLIRHLWQLKTVVFLHLCLIFALLLFCFVLATSTVHVEVDFLPNNMP
jgi:hypothetical protein